MIRLLLDDVNLSLSYIGQVCTHDDDLDIGTEEKIKFNSFLPNFVSYPSSVTQILLKTQSAKATNTLYFLVTLHVAAYCQLSVCFDLAIGQHNCRLVNESFKSRLRVTDTFS